MLFQYLGDDGFPGSGSPITKKDIIKFLCFNICKALIKSIIPLSLINLPAKINPLR